MKFLAPLQNLFKQEAPRTSSPSLVPIARPVARPTQRPLESPRTMQTARPVSTPGPRLKPWEEPKRIQRLRALAQLSSYGKSQIELVQVSGLWAQIALRLYDNMPEQEQYRFVAMPMPKLYEHINTLWNSYQR